MWLRGDIKIYTPERRRRPLVLRTGFETAQGSLMRTILFATEQVTGSTETGKFIGVLLISPS